MFILSSANAFNMDQSKMLSFGRVKQSSVILLQRTKFKKLRTLGDKKINLGQSMNYTYVFERVENIVGEGESTCYHNVFTSPFPCQKTWGLPGKILTMCILFVLKNFLNMIV